jgi:uncharacterized membrane protein
MQPIHRVSLSCALTAIAVIGLSEHAFAQTKYVATGVGTLGGTVNYPAGINNSGQVTGYSAQAGDLFNLACRTDADQPINPATDDLGLLNGGSFSTAVGIHNSGQVAGYTFFTSSSGAFRADPGKPLLDLGAFSSNPPSSNANGVNFRGSGTLNYSSDLQRTSLVSSGRVEISLESL